MTCRMRWSEVLVCLILSLFSTNLATAYAAGLPPNVVLIMTDDQGFGDLGFHGNPIVRTPRLDALAKESARWPMFYVSPVCTPTRASLLTGRYNYRTAAIDTYRGRALLHPAETTLAERLRKAGYETGIFGKWHLGDTWPLRPSDRGFDLALVHRGGGIGQPSDPPGSEGKYTDPLLFRNGVPEPQHGYCTDVYFEQGIRFAGEAHARGKPFFLYLPTNAPHGPFHDVPADKLAYYRTQRITADRFPQSPGHPPPKQLDADLLARVYAMIENVDDNVGRLLDWLDRERLAENTLVIFLTDNGEATAGYNAGLRSFKGDVYEGGIRSPLFLRWPGRLAPGEGPRHVAAHIDLPPTILEACGLPHRLAEFDGRSLWPQLTRTAVDWPDRTVFIQSHRGDVPVKEHHFAARNDRWKLVRSSGFGRERPAPDAPFELFDMQGDPYETRDVARSYPEVVAQLRDEYARWFTDVSSTRVENYAPVRLQIGGPQEIPVILTRQDWRGADWKPQDRGSWEVDVVTAGTYVVTVRFAPFEEPAEVEFKLGSVRRVAQVETGVRNVVFDEVPLAAGPARVESAVETANHLAGVMFVEFQRLTPADAAN